MKKKIFQLVVLFQLITATAIVTHNSYFDIGLIEKNGVFDLNKYLYDSYIMGFGSFGGDDFTEGGAKLRLSYKPSELKGFYFNADMVLSKISVREVGGDAGDWWGGNVPFFGEAYFGFDSKIFDFSLGYQNAKSSDSIYHSLLIDDYSGAFLSYRSNLSVTRFFDFQVMYNIVRIHQGPWYNGDITYDYSNIMDTWVKTRGKDEAYGKVGALYGKSLYFHKANIRPAPWIRFGLMESVYFIGENLNAYFANPLFIYFAVQMIDKSIAQKTGSTQGTQAASLKIGLDFSVGFDGWRLYGEMMIDDANGEYITFDQPDHPDRVGFVIGGELRGYLFDKYLRLPRGISFFISNLYLNLEFAAVSRFAYSRDPNYNYEYVRDEFPYKYYPEHFKDKVDGEGNLLYPDYVAYTEADRNKLMRQGNFIGYMYGNNADSFDFAIGWRNDLGSVADTTGNYINDRYLESLKKRKYYDRQLKIQFHYRRYRLGEYRDVGKPFYLNEHFFYDLDPYTDSDGDGDPGNDKSELRTGFVDKVVERGDIFDINFYTDIIRVNRFVIGFETKFELNLTTFYPDSAKERSTLDSKIDIGIILGF